MNFRGKQGFGQRFGVAHDEPEISFIPLIDILMVVLIFLMVTTSYNKFTELKINLPTVDGEKKIDVENAINIGISSDGRYAVNDMIVPFQHIIQFSEVLKDASKGMRDPIVIINADAGSSHQAVVNIMEAARVAALPKITFATKTD
jgi:biopolymer transport protein ExbD